MFPCFPSIEDGDCSPERRFAGAASSSRCAMPSWIFSGTSGVTLRRLSVQQFPANTRLNRWVQSHIPLRRRGDDFWHIEIVKTAGSKSGAQLGRTLTRLSRHLQVFSQQFVFFVSHTCRIPKKQGNTQCAIAMF